MQLYETDFYAWTQKQANLLRHQQWNQLDLSNLIEEIECLGKQQRAELRNRWSVLIAHLLKWEYQPDLQEVLQKAYIKAIVLASGETNLPKDCPYTLEDILSDRFFPGSPTTDEIME